MTALDFKAAMQKRNIAWHANIHPLDSEDVDLEAFDDINNQTIERFYQNYLISNGNLLYRFVILGLWTVDIKERIKYLSEEPQN